ncbi:transposase [Streptomyces sp. 404i]|nr:transposase [Streptomyces sp. 404i]
MQPAAPPTSWASRDAAASFELRDALLCTGGPVRTLVDLALAPEHRRGHWALYGGLDQGRIDVAVPRRALAGVPLPRVADDRLVPAVGVPPWLRLASSARRSRRLGTARTLG